MPTSCIHTGVTPDACNPITNARCTKEQTCDFITGEDFEMGFACAHIQAEDRNEGEPCDNVAGPFCLTGMHCVHRGSGQECAYMCCGDSDCRGTATKCVPLNKNKVGTFGFCQ